MLDEKIETMMKHLCDGVIELSLKEADHEIQRRMKFIKFKGIIVPRVVIRYDLTDKGVKMESTMRVI